MASTSGLSIKDLDDSKPRCNVATIAITNPIGENSVERALEVEYRNSPFCFPRIPLPRVKPRLTTFFSITYEEPSLADKLHRIGREYHPGISLKPSRDHRATPNWACANPFGHCAPSRFPDFRDCGTCSRP